MSVTGCVVMSIFSENVPSLASMMQRVMMRYLTITHRSFCYEWAKTIALPRTTLK